ncbi:head GIN domain-containing protein [uncultured Maribacter sp.]|uniref:head GIN domain-containing protein n=1 Tax=uncultured Maribacter sp. TaxID=431308 RepID=UPI0030D7B873|tara:strand:+ start:387 stop:1067 length:681 start_codon:yes stop_codon:yes gene_type:complete
MKPIIIIAIFICSTFSCFAQSISTIPLHKFNALKVYDRITVTLIKGQENKLVLSGVDKDDVSITENNGLLKVKMAINEFLSGNEVNAKLYFTEELKVIDANENARIVSSGIIKSSTIEIRSQEAALITLNIDVETVNAKSTSGSELKLTGTTNYQDANINTGGKLYNKDLKSKTTSVIVLGGGIAEVYASEKVIVKVKAGGSIQVFGNPKTIDKDDRFGGRIEFNN